jgi:hypothetical protein
MSRASSSFASRGSSILRLAVALGAAAGVTLAAAQAQAQEPELVAAPAAFTCSLGDHAGVESADAETVRSLFAQELAARRAPPGAYEVRIGKLGSKLLLTLSDRRADGTIDERHTLIGGVEEASVAAPRLVDALANGKPVEETQTVSNVLTQEARSPVTKQGKPGFIGDVIAVTPVGIKTGVAAGADLGVTYEMERFALFGIGRIAGGSSGSQYGFTYFNLGVGARYFLTDGDVAPYVGGGAGFSGYSADADGTYNTYNSAGPTSATGRTQFGATGFNLHAEVGVEAFRTHHACLLAGLRLDTPLFELADGSGEKRYAMPVSLTVGLIFK